MSAQLPPEPDAMHQDHGEAGSGLAFEYWPQMLVGTLLAMGVLGIGATDATRNLIWLPPAAFVGWIALSIIFRPRHAAEKHDLFEYEEFATPPSIGTAAGTALPAEQPVPAAAVEAKPVEAAPAPAAKPAPKPAAPPADFAKADVVILWGSESGNCQGLAEMAETRLNDAGMSAQAVDMGHVKLEQLPACKNVLVICSTWGDGDPPSNAIDLWEAFQKDKVDLSSVRFSVLALGDTAYTQFCKCGKDFDEFFESNGAKRIHPRRDCDLDFEKPYEEWITAVQKAVQSQMAAV